MIIPFDAQLVQGVATVCAQAQGIALGAGAQAQVVVVAVAFGIAVVGMRLPNV
ncbi:hypothetical protein N5K35_24465 [Pseudomonas sp. GD03651]|uniref:hypothetical protein n=1 Tax=Pseudomonas TaxID=286 RepID=UPI00034EF242|nr:MULTISPECIES: hypothetical protein [Pseudomonas]AGN82805.1 hypothetical protein L483_20135 [Pseudomonas putida H8234]MDH2186845.1 hypothetical protein [Pseudomonas sp. GD03651]HDS1814775.1 hypothetical protein [Pseudomonas putida]HDS3811497.1 hypothetical protein [Pseudomonas putida]